MLEHSNKEFVNLVKGFNSTPFLFIGSGFSRRYYNLPGWVDLLKHFCRLLSEDEFAYEGYYQEAASNLKSEATEAEKLAQIATLLNEDFNKKWFADNDFRNFNKSDLEQVRKGVSPFKIAIAKYIDSQRTIVLTRQEEIALFKTISRKSISGIITTNYDTLLENETDNFKTYVGQEELIFSPIQGYGEIYKIHGSVTDPVSIVITTEDYEEFNRRAAYLAAKLLTIFMENPIIFMGYSLGDPNIRLILEQIGKCLSEKNLERIQNRFIYVEHNKDKQELEISKVYFSLGSKNLGMTSIKTDNFIEIYRILGEKRAALPAKLFRIFKEELYNYTLTNQPTSNLYIASIDDNRVEDEHLVLAIAQRSELANRGLMGITGEQWFTHIVLNNLQVSADDLLEYGFPDLSKKLSPLPICRLLREAKRININDYSERAIKSYESILTTTIKKNRDRYRAKLGEKNIDWILTNHGTDPIRVMDLIPNLYEDEIEIETLEKFLITLLRKPGFYKDIDAHRGKLHRLIRIYDYLKYGKPRPLVGEPGSCPL